MKIKKLKSSELDGAIFGTLLGDASLNKTSINGNYNLTLTHSPKQKEYLEFKKNLLEQISHVNFTFKQTTSFNKKMQKDYTTYYYYTNYLKYFTKLHDIFYKNSNKIVTAKILNKLTPLGLALWWQDDGSLVIHTRKDRGTVQRTATLATCSFSLEEHELIIKYFKDTWNINCKLGSVTNGINNYNVIRFPMKEFTKFVEIVKPFIQSSMYYKIDFKYKNASQAKEKSLDAISVNEATDNSA